MDKIALVGMKFFAYHGYYEEEQIVGANYILDVEVNTNFSKAGQSDDLKETINYENIYMICKEVMAIKAKLLEHVVHKIEFKLCETYPTIKGLNIKLQKLSPPLGAAVKSSQVQIIRNYQKTCPRCKSGFLCHNAETCWCINYRISPATTENLKKEFKGCLCENCLSEYGSK